MKRNNLSLKGATKLSVAHYNATKNPFLIYQFCDILEKTLTQLGMKHRPGLVWNCDKSGLSHEPKKCKVTPKRGQNTIQVS